MSAAEAIVVMGEPQEISGPQREWVSIEAKCSACDYRVYTGAPHNVTENHDWGDYLLGDHLAQHQPGRALDMAVDWVPSASCTVCEDGVGAIEQEDDYLTCRTCQTTWNMDGTGGERAES